MFTGKGPATTLTLETGSLCPPCPLSVPAQLALTQVLRGAAGLLDETILQLGQVEVTDDDLGVLQAVVVHQVLQLPDQGT